MDPAQIEALLDGPAGAPPPGVEPNLENPPNIQSIGRGLLLTCFCLATVSLIIRLYTKIFILHRFKASDCSIIVGWGIFVGYAAASWLLNNVAPGVDQWNMSLRNFESMLYYGHAGSIMYGICIFFIKLSILLQYLEIFVPLRTSTTNYIYWSSHTLIWLLLIFYLISTFLEIFSCRPVAKAWNPLLDGTCPVNTLVLNVAASSINSLTDLVIFALPQVAIWRLQTSTRKKISVSAMFFVAILACVSSVIRLSYAVLLYRTKNNISWYFYLAGLWTIPELGLGIVSSSLPVAPKFMKTMAKNRYICKLGYSIQSLIGRGSLRSNERTDSFPYPSDDNHALRAERNGNLRLYKLAREEHVKAPWDDEFPLVHQMSGGSNIATHAHHGLDVSS